MRQHLRDQDWLASESVQTAMGLGLRICRCCRACEQDSGLKEAAEKEQQEGGERRESGGLRAVSAHSGMI
jgi:hypothetical protein